MDCTQSGLITRISWYLSFVCIFIHPFSCTAYNVKWLRPGQIFCLSTSVLFSISVWHTASCLVRCLLGIMYEKENWQPMCTSSKYRQYASGKEQGHRKYINKGNTDKTNGSTNTSWYGPVNIESILIWQAREVRSSLYGTYCRKGV